MLTVSSAGKCRLFVDGSVSCDSGVTPPTGGLFVQIAASQDVLAARDATGAMFFPGVTFPAGPYAEVAANDGRTVGAVGDDGTVVAYRGTTQMVRTGSYQHVAVDG